MKRILQVVAIALLFSTPCFALNRIQLRRDTAANWTAANPILSEGEAGFETDTNKLKIGNGTSAWANLSYITASGSSFATSAELAAILSDETGTGTAVFSTSPTLVTPVLGAATATSLTLSTDLAIADGGTAASDQQTALDNLTDVASTTDGYVLTRDPGTDRAEWIAPSGGYWTESGLLDYLSTTANKVAIGRSSLISTEKFVIDGSADIIQAIIRGNATQTPNIFEVRKSDNSVLLGVSETGITAGGSTAGIFDTNGNELFLFTATGSAVNELTYANAATGTNPKWTSSGESNVGQDFQAKGTGAYRFLSTASNSTDLRLFEDADAGSNYVSLMVPSLAGNIVYTLPADDGDAGEQLQSDGSGNLTWETAGSIVSYWQFKLSPQGSVLDDGAPPSMTIIESSGTGTPRFYVLDFDPATDQIVYWTFVVPTDMAAGDWLVDVNWYTNDTGASEDAIWYAAISATSEGDADTMAEQAIGTLFTAAEDCNATEANRLIQTTITLTSMDSVAAGDIVTVVFGRDADDSIGNADNDGLSSNARFVSANLRIPRA